MLWKHLKLISTAWSNVDCVLSPLGEIAVKQYIKELHEKKKEILDAGKDTADETELPTYEDIISDIETFYGADGTAEYCNLWGVTDNYNADFPLRLSLGHEIITKQLIDSFEINKEKFNLHESADIIKLLECYGLSNKEIIDAVNDVKMQLVAKEQVAENGR